MRRPGPPLAKRLALGAILAAVGALAAHAQIGPGAPDIPVPTVAAALTDDVVRITSRFTGARIDVFGVVNGLRENDDVVVVVRGPRQPVRIMRKQRRVGVWMNGEPALFEGAPAFYATASTRPLTEIASLETLSQHDIGAEQAPLRAVGDGAERAAAQIAEYRAALVRIKARDGQYRDVPDGVDVFDGGLFRARVIVLPGAPTGAYRAEVFVFRDGVLAARRSAELQVVKVGIERFVYDAAHMHPLLYGVSAVAFAVFAGWSAAAVFRRR